MPSVLRCRIALDKRHLSPEQVFGRGKPSVPLDRGGRDRVDSDSGRTPFEREDRRGRLTQPVLFVHGTCDRLVPVAAGCLLAVQRILRYGRDTGGMDQFAGSFMVTDDLLIRG